MKNEVFRENPSSIKDFVKEAIKKFWELEKELDLSEEERDVYCSALCHFEYACRLTGLIKN